MRRRGRAHEHVDVGERRPALVVVHRDRAVSLGELRRALERAVGDDRRAHALIVRGTRARAPPSRLRRAPSRACRASEPKICFASCTAAELTDAAPRATDVSLRTRPATEQRRLKEAVEHRPRMRRDTLPRVAHLPVNLRFAKHHRVETAGDAEEMRRPRRGRAGRSRTPTHRRRAARRARPMTAGAASTSPSTRYNSVRLQVESSTASRAAEASRSSRQRRRDFRSAAYAMRSRMSSDAPRWLMPTTVSAIRRSPSPKFPDSTRSQNSSPTSAAAASVHRSRLPDVDAARGEARQAPAPPSRSGRRPRGRLHRECARPRRNSAGATPRQRVSPHRCTAGVMKSPSSGRRRRSRARPRPRVARRSSRSRPDHPSPR